jgi:Spy/CpxP family protein refolding chaperone
MENEKQDMPAAPVENHGATSSGWGRRIAIGGVALAALAGIGLVAANSGEFRRDHGMRHFGMGAHMERASMGGMGFGERRLEHFLDEIDATPEQSEKLKAIFGSARNDIGPMFEDLRDTRKAAADILGAATIDRAAAEKLRSERVAALDAASRKMTAALLDAAEVLTPEQRTELVEHFKERGGHGRW